MDIEEVDTSQLVSASADSRVSATASSGGGNGLHWTCKECGHAKNINGSKCLKCSARTPLAAIGASMSLAHTVLAGSHDETALARDKTGNQSAHRVGAMAGWACAMGDAESGAPLPAAFEHSALMQKEAKRARFVDRPHGFNAVLDAISRDNARMPPPPPRYFSDANRQMPTETRKAPDGRHYTKAEFFGFFNGYTEWDAAAGIKRAREATDGWSDDGRSRNTSQYTLNSTYHSHMRGEQRELLRLQLQRCIKRGTCERSRSHADRWIFNYNGITLVTDDSQKIAISAFRGGAGSGFGAPKIILVEEHATFDLTRDAREPPPITPRSPGVSTPREKSSVSRSRSQSLGRGDDHYAAVCEKQMRLGSIDEQGRQVVRYGQDDSNDKVGLLKKRARLVNEKAIAGGARDAGILWRCEHCDFPDNVAFMSCISCGEQWSAEQLETLKRSARRVLEEHPDHAKMPDNPFRQGTLGGYALGRYKAVVEQAVLPNCFEQVKELMPPPPKQEDCRQRLPDGSDSLLGLTLSADFVWPDEEPAPTAEAGGILPLLVSPAVARESESPA